MEPIHIFLSGDLEKINEFLATFKKNKYGRKKMSDYIAALIQSKNLESFAEICTQDLVNYMRWNPCEFCGSFGTFEMYMYCHNTLCDDKKSCLTGGLIGAVKNLNYEMFEYIINQEKFDTIREKVLDDEDYCEIAAAKNDLPMLIYLHERGFKMDSGVCSEAASFNNMEMLLFALQNGCVPDEDAIAYAAKGGHYDIVKYLHENEAPWDETAAVFAGRNGHLDVLAYLVENGAIWDKNVIIAACKEDTPNNLACVEYALNHGSIISKSAALYCAIYGSINILTYLLSKDAPLVVEVANEAAKRGDLPMLTLLHENNCPWNHITSYWALKNGYIAAYDYCIVHGCDLPIEGENYYNHSVYDYIGDITDDDDQDDNDDEENQNN
jgi:hypothetical protein